MSMVEIQVFNASLYTRGKQTVVFKEDRPLEGLQKKRKTTLLNWFDLNRENSAARSLKYHEIPENYVWDDKKTEMVLVKKR